jgi:hypothetical protein
MAPKAFALAAQETVTQNLILWQRAPRLPIASAVCILAVQIQREMSRFGRAKLLH